MILLRWIKNKSTLLLSGFILLVLLALGIWVGMKLYHCSQLNKTLTQEVKVLARENQVLSTLKELEKANNTTLRASIEEQNRALISLQQKRESLIKEYKELQQVNEKDRFQIIYKEVKSNECLDVFNSIDNIRRAERSRL